MPSILDQKFVYELVFSIESFDEVRLYCENNVGYRTHWMRNRIGGKQWYISRMNSDNQFKLGLNDSAHATILALKYGN